MKRDWQEKRIRQLFHELGDEDERTAPSFAGVMQVALLRARGARGGVPIWRIAAAAATLVVAVTIALLLRTNESTEPVPIAGLMTLELHKPIEIDPPVAPVEPPTAPVDSPTGSAKRRRSQRSDSSTHTSSVLISRWRSPTDCLLSVPGNELLKSLPRVPDPLPGIARSLIQNHN